jgi:SAM-dependent methyltransferase
VIEESAYRTQLWRYYDRRVEEVEATGLARAVEYWHGLGVAVSVSAIESEDTQVREVLHSLGPALFLEVGSGPGTYTSAIPARGIALEQSAAALRVLLACVSGVPAVRANALALPLRDASVERVFAGHIYGILDEAGRHALLSEARRVAREVVVVDSGRPAGVPAEHWQQRTIGQDSEVFSVLRRHFEAQELADEIGGRVLFAGQYYVVVVTLK